MNSPKKSIRVAFLNQSIGTLFAELVDDVADQLGPCRVITGTRTQFLSSQVTVRQLAEYNRRSMLSRLGSWVFFAFGAFIEVLTLNRRVPILVVSNPPFMSWIVAFIHVLRQQPYVILIYDLYPDILVQKRILAWWHPITTIWRLMNRWAYSHASYVVTIGSHMAISVKKSMSADSQIKLHVIPTWVDTDRFVPRDKKTNSFVIQTGQAHKFTVLYSGNIGLTHDITILVDAALQLVSNSNIHFLVVGEGNAKGALIKRAWDAGLDNITFLPFQSDNDLPFSLAAGDVAVVSIAEGIEGLMMPSKTYYSMAVGSAILGISNAPNDLSDIIEQGGCGQNVAHRDVKGFVCAIEALYTNRLYLQSCQQAARLLAKEQFSRHANTQKFVDILDTLLSKESS